MKTGKSLVDLAMEIQRRAEAKHDVVADTRALEVYVPPADAENTAPALHVVGDGFYRVTPHAHGQMADHLGIPKKYYDRLLSDAPALFKENVEHWLKMEPSRRLVRTLDGQARAFLSDRYRRFDNEDLAEAVLPVLLESPDIKLVSCDVTDRKLYLKALFPKIEGEVVVGDQVQSGIVISNSEIGDGSVSVQPLVYRLVCSNGMIASDYALNRYHVGRRLESGGVDVQALYRDETVAADDKALSMKIQDVVRSFSTQERFDAVLAKMRAAATEGPRIERPVVAVEVLAKSVGLRDSEKQSVLENLIRGQDYSRWGALNAITALANNHPDYDRATALEYIGGQVLDLPVTDWQRIAVAA